MDWPGHKRQRSTLRLYRNNRNGTFTDVTRAAGLDVEMYGMGVAVGDFNNDGFPDLFITCVGQNRLFRNTGKGTFVDVTRASGLGGRAGVQHLGAVVRLRSRRPPRPVRLQLRQVVARARRVLQPRRQAEVVLHARGVSRRHLLAVPQPRQRHVRGRHGDERHLRHQLEVARRGACSTTTRTAGPTCSSPTTRSRTSCIATSATARSRTSRVEAGLAFSDDGKARAGMGVDAGDFDNSGRAGLAITNFDNEMIGLYRPQERRALRGRRDRGRASAPPRATRSVSAASSPTSISTAASISSSPTAISTRPSGTSAATSATRSRRSCS